MSAVPVWRLCAAQYAATAYDGEGARRYGGRWSPPGIPLAYCAESRALTVVEVLANAEETDRLLALAWVLVPAEIPGSLIEKPPRFPENWRRFPHPASTQEVGAAWARKQRSAALRVPSVVVPGEFNYLLNPRHPDFAAIRVGKPESFSFAPRLGG